MTLPGHTPPPESPPGEGSTLPYGQAANKPAPKPHTQTGRRALHWRDGEGEAPPPGESSPSGSWVMPAGVESASPEPAPPRSASAASSSGSWVGAAGEAELRAAREATPYPPADQGDHDGIVLTLGWLEQVLQLTLPTSVQVRVAGVGKTWKLCVNEKEIVDVVSSMAHYVRTAMPDGGTLTMHCMPMDIKEGETSIRLGLTPGKYVYMGISHTQQAAVQVSMADKPSRARIGLDTCFRMVSELGGSMSMDRKSEGITGLNIYLPAVE